MSESSRQVRKLGESHVIEKLTTAKWKADQIDGWEMTGIAARHVGAVSAYRSPDGDGYSFLLFTEVRWAEGAEKENK